MRFDFMVLFPDKEFGTIFAYHRDTNWQNNRVKFIIYVERRFKRDIFKNK